MSTISTMQPIMPAPRGVIFDFDGTLVDSFGLVIHAWNAACREPMGRTYSDEEVISRFGLTEVNMLRRELPAAYFEKARRVFLDEYRTRHREMCTIFDGINDLLDMLTSRAVPMAIMTGKGRDTADIALAELEWTRLFKSVVTGDEVEEPKPDPQGPLRAARELGITPRECVFIGDSPADIGAGKAAGMRTIWAGWHPVYAEKVRALAPDHVAHTPNDLKLLLQDV
jgi:HAD superfamily hydrolase (TIGR01549 family)